MIKIVDFVSDEKEEKSVSSDDSNKKDTVKS